MFDDPIHCPCCSRPVQGSLSADLLALALDLTPAQGAILRAVSAGNGHAVPTDSILRAIYEDEDNPPDHSRQYATFKEKLSLMRTRLAGAGLAIENVGRGEGYRRITIQKTDALASQGDSHRIIR
ncbi:hypothetical protein [Paracoccus fontiphilus]|uniref:Transcriptional regulatory protein, C terminal n=1 Tax=Paracoccus fontiphilus TaxID=1815556 RepID=A0ABV7I8E7_9RHOB|nr:hypothetical protein [Paracoccus fontiphilus]